MLIKDLLRDFNIEIDKPINIFQDNSGAVSIAKFGNFTKRSKYIEVHYHFVNENYVNRESLLQSHEHSQKPDMPEHYELENANSVALSDRTGSSRSGPFNRPLTEVPPGSASMVHR